LLVLYFYFICCIRGNNVSILEIPCNIFIFEHNWLSWAILICFCGILIVNVTWCRSSIVNGSILSSYPRRSSWSVCSIELCSSTWISLKFVTWAWVWQPFLVLHYAFLILRSLISRAIIWPYQFWMDISYCGSNYCACSCLRALWAPSSCCIYRWYEASCRIVRECGHCIVAAYWIIITYCFYIFWFKSIGNIKSRLLWFFQQL